MYNSALLKKFSLLISFITAVGITLLAALYILKLQADNPHFITVVMWTSGVCFTFGCVFLSLRHPVRALRLLTIFYYIAGSAAAIIAPAYTIITVLAFSLCIICGSLSFGRHFSLVGAIACITTLIAMYLLVIDDTLNTYSYETLLSQSLLIGCLAYFCWHSLSMTDRYYRKFGKQLDRLSSRMDDYEKQLKDESHEELLMLYKFADAGRKSVAVLHNLANHLTLIALDNDKTSYKHLNSLIAEAYESLQATKISEFDVFDLLTKETIPTLRTVADTHNVTIECAQEQSQFPSKIVGDHHQLGLIVTILVHNAIEAYRNTKSARRLVALRISYSESTCTITVDDYGSGIPPSVRRRLFGSRQNQSKERHGIGLLTAQEITVRHFAGTLTLDSRRDMTRFRMTLPTSQKQ